MKIAFAVSCSLLLAASIQAQLVWMVGRDDNAWPMGDGGGPNTSFIQENGSINPLPGSPMNPEVRQQSDNDYYFAGDYSTLIDSIIAHYGTYTPVGPVSVNEEGAERAFAGGDNDLRYHFNLPETLQPTDLLSVTFDANSLHTANDGVPLRDPRYGIEVYFNGVLVQPQIVIRPPQLDVDYTTPQFTLESVNARVGSGFDNIVSLKGVNYGSDGGGQWMGIDYVQLNAPTNVIPPAVFPWAVGLNDDAHPMGDGGGPNTSFVQENGSIQPLPGSPTSPEVNRQSDNDYYFAGDYRTTISSVVARYGPYTPVGTVPVNEEGAERAFAADDNDLRYHFNLPNTVGPNDQLAISFDALSLDMGEPGREVPDPRYGVEIYFNGVLVQPQIIIRPDRLGQTFTTPAFTLGSVNGASGSGFDNIVSLRGINYNNEGGGNWMGIDYLQLNPGTNAAPVPVLPWSVGADDDGWPVGNGGGSNATFVAGDGISNPLPGNPMNEEFDFDADDDYYLGGAYTTVISGNGSYVPVGIVPANEEAAAQGFAGTDNTLRYHFNLPGTLRPDDLLTVTFDALNLDTADDPRYGVEVYFNGVLVGPEVIIRPAQLGQPISTPQFTAGSVNAQPGTGFDNIITLRGISYSDQNGGALLGLDYIRLTPHPRITFPWMVGRDDGDHLREGDGGGTNATFWQENGGINPLPGRPNNPEADQQSDNDYYFSGVYTATISSVVTHYGAYTPVGIVLPNEEGAERAFAAADNDLRYHFNLPASLGPDEQLSITFDANNLDTDNGTADPADDPTDPRYGIEIYFNGVLVQTQIVIRPPQLDIDYTTPPFTLSSVNAQTGFGADNIVSLKGVNYNAEGGGNWMGIDYVQLGLVPLRFLPATVSGGRITLTWTGNGQLEWARDISGPWNPIDPAPSSPYSEDVVPGENRFYRLRRGQ